VTLDFDERDRRSVVGDLRSEDEEVRRLAVERVDALPLREAIPHLVERLGDPSWRVRKAAVERLVACPDERATEGLIAALADGENPGRRNGAVEALVRAGSRVTPRLVRAVQDADADVRKFAVDALAGIGGDGAGEALVERLGDPDANVRAAAADALGAVGGAAAERALAEVVRNGGEERLVRFSALRALEALGRTLPVAELEPILDDPVLRPAALALLSEDEGGAALEILLKALASESRATRESAMRSVLRLVSSTDGPGVDEIQSRVQDAADAEHVLVPDAVDRLAGADLGTRLVLIQFLGLLRSQPAVLPILRAASDEALAEVALTTLAGMEDAAEAAVDAGWDALDADARRDACILFGRTRGSRGAARLVLGLEDQSPEIRSAAARSIGQRRMVEAVPVLVMRLEAAAGADDFESEGELAALTDSLAAVAGRAAPEDVSRQAVSLLASRLDGAPESVRLAIAVVLGRIGRREDAELVTFLLKDPSAGVRRAAVDALAHLDSAAAEPLRLALADESPLVRMAAAAAVSAGTDDGVQADLQNLAADEDALVRAAAVRAVGARFTDHADPERRSAARALLRRALSDEAPVALAALEALREGCVEEGERLVPVLTRSEPEVLQEAARCLAVVGRPEHIEALLPLVGHPEWAVRAEAIQVLADRGCMAAAPAILRRLDQEQDEFVREVLLAALRRLDG
jgi:HEAT repeat protein